MMWIDDELSSELASELKELGLRGDALAKEDGEATAAIAAFRAAFDLIPEPKENYLATTWLLVAIGDTAYLAGDLDTAAESFRRVGICNGWHDNAFVWLRRGQIAFDTGDMKRAASDLAAAFMLGGYEIFDTEDDKYPIFALSHLKPPSPPVDHRLARFHLPPDPGEQSGGERR